MGKRRRGRRKSYRMDGRSGACRPVLCRGCMCIVSRPLVVVERRGRPPQKSHLFPPLGLVSSYTSRVRANLPPPWVCTPSNPHQPITNTKNDHHQTHSAVGDCIDLFIYPIHPSIHLFIHPFVRCFCLCVVLCVCVCVCVSLLLVWNCHFEDSVRSYKTYSSSSLS